MSRRLSPRKLKARTAVKIARPGKVPIHQYWKYCVPVATIEPHSGSGGCAPRPRKESPASRRIAVPRSSVARTSTPPAMFGSTSRNSARRAETPRSREDCTYSESPIDRTRPRTTREYAGQATITMARTALRRPRPRTAVTTIARMIAGNAKTRSAVRMTMPSVTPRK